jgi:hypothetical protein
MDQDPKELAWLRAALPVITEYQKIQEQEQRGA